jgi:hypothetical protein
MGMFWKRPNVIFVPGLAEGPVGFPTKFAESVARLHQEAEAIRLKAEEAEKQKTISLQREQQESTARMHSLFFADAA